MLTVGDRLPQFDLQATVEPREGQGIRADHRPELSRPVAGPLLLADGLHLRLPDRDRRVRQAERATSRTATRRCSGVEHRHPLRPPGLAAGPPGSRRTCRSRCWPTPSASCRRRSASCTRRTASPLRATFIVDPAGRHPLRQRQRPLGRPQRRRGAARARRAADRRALPVQLEEGRADAGGGVTWTRSSSFARPFRTRRGTSG